MLQAWLSGMSQDDWLRVELPARFLDGSVSDLLDRVFPVDPDAQQEIVRLFDLRANPDLPEIYGVFLAVCEEWRDWRCSLRVSKGGNDVGLDAVASRLLPDGDGPLELRLRFEQDYRPLEYAVRHGFCESREELLGWMRSLTALYFLDKHEVELLASPQGFSSPVLYRALVDLESQGIITPLQPAEEVEEPSQPGAGLYGITTEGRGFISELLAETETYIDQYDHFQDVLVDADGETVEFGTGRGADLRVQAFMADDLDPIRTVFLLRLYDGTLDARLRDWARVLETDEFFEAILEPVVNRDGVSPEAMLLVLEEGSAWLEEQQAEAQRERQDQEILARARRNAPR